jgi:hypothetical protein
MADGLILVKFRFDGEGTSQIGRFTRKQYNNLKMLPITVECKIISDETPTLNEQEVKLINKKIADACKSDTSHVSKLSQ